MSLVIPKMMEPSRVPADILVFTLSTLDSLPQTKSNWWGVGGPSGWVMSLHPELASWHQTPVVISGMNSLNKGPGTGNNGQQTLLCTL